MTCLFGAVLVMCRLIWWMSDSVSGADELIAEQHSDASVADCWQQAR